MPREKSRYRERRSSSYSSESSYEKKSRSKHKRRSRSKDRSQSNSHRRKRSTSRSRHKRRSYSRSVSRDRYEKYRRRSPSRSRSKRDRSRSRSRSNSTSRSKYRRRRKSHRRSRSSSSSGLDIERPIVTKKVNLDDTESKVEKAIKAAAAAGLTMTKIPTYEYKEVEIKEDMPSIHDRNLLAELNSESFVQKTFTSSKSKKESKNIIIDLNTQTVHVPEPDVKEKDEAFINFDEIPNEEELKEMWIKKLYQYRKRMLKGEI